MHPLLLQYAPSIARDLGKPLDYFDDNTQALRQEVEKVNNGNMGVKAETRRWWTVWEANDNLVKI